MVWQYKALGELAEVSSGGTPKKANSEFWDGDIPWYSSGELNEHFTISSKEHITEAGLDGSNAKLFPEGSLLIGMYDTAALKMSILDRAGAFNQAIAGVKPNSELDLSFVLYAITNIKPELMKLRRGVRQKNLNQGKIKEIPIPDIDIAEQKRIVAILDQAFDDIEQARAKTEQNLKNVRELFDSYLQQVFSQRGEGWVEKKLIEIAQVIDSLHKTPKYSDNGYPMVRVTDVKQRDLDLSSAKRVDQAIYEEFSKKYKAKVGDIVFSRVGSYGRSSVVTTDELFCLGQNTVFLAPSINGYYFYYFLNSQSAKDQIDKLVSGSTQPTVSLKSIKAIRVPVPPKDQQLSIVEKMNLMSNEVDGLELLYEQKLTELDELKKSILQKAFSGELNKD